MKQTVKTMKPDHEPVSDLDMVFLALYNLLAEKLKSEPNKGIVYSKGKPNQRKATWSDIMVMAHALEDFFIFRKQRTNGKECQLCKHWKSISEASPHMGRCCLRKQDLVHAFSSCKRFEEGNQH